MLQLSSVLFCYLRRTTQVYSTKLQSPHACTRDIFHGKFPCHGYLLLFVFSPNDRYSAILQFLLQILVYSKCHSLTRCHTHDTGGDSLIECVKSFLSIDH